MIRFRRTVTVAVVALIALGGATVASTARAAADTAPAPDCYSTSASPTGEICVPQTWDVETNVITNDGLVQCEPLTACLTGDHI
jgi:hypothetical protein